MSYLVKFKEGKATRLDFIEASSLEEAWQIASQKYGRFLLSVGLFKK